jgi:hypothetical protein
MAAELELKGTVAIVYSSGTATLAGPFLSCQR